MKDLFQLQTELIDSKVNMAVNNAIDRVIEQINNLKNEVNSLRTEMHVDIHNLRDDMSERFSSLEQRVTAVETKLGIVNETQREIRIKLIDYSFRAGWLALGAALSYVIIQFHALVK
jgi:uncharacterized coiled-coil DUF342 family protein